MNTLKCLLNLDNTKLNVVDIAVAERLLDYNDKIFDLAKSDQFTERELISVLYSLTYVYNTNISIFKGKKGVLDLVIGFIIDVLTEFSKRFKDDMLRSLSINYKELLIKKPSNEEINQFTDSYAYGYTKMLKIMDIIIQGLKSYEKIEVSFNDDDAVVNSSQNDTIKEDFKKEVEKMKTSRRRFPSKKIRKTHTKYWTTS